MNITADTMLHRSPELDLTVESNGEVSIYLPEGSVRLGAHGLLLIDSFSPSATISSAVRAARKRLAGTGSFDDLIDDIMKLVACGVLKPGVTTPSFSRHMHPLGLYDSSNQQIRLLSDELRRRAFLDAVSETVRPEDVVLDLGTGTGIMAVAAARRGARRIYAVEPSRVAAAARKVFEAAGVSDRVTLIEGWIQHQVLPEKADVLTLDLLGFKGLDMALPEIVAEARERHLKPGARIVPQAVSMALCPVEVPEDVWNAQVVTAEQVNCWKDLYDIDFSALKPSVPTTFGVTIEPELALGFPQIGASQSAFSLDLERGALEVKSTIVQFPDVSPTRRFGVIGIVEAQLSPSVRFATNPALAGAAPHWLVPLWLYARPEPDATAIPSCRFDYLGRGRVSVLFKELEEDTCHG